MRRFQSLSLDLIEILPSSSPALREILGDLLERSQSLSVAIASLDHSSGTYKLVIQGTLPEKARMHQNAA